MIDTSNLNVLTLAYIGDAIYEIYIRTHLVSKGITKVNSLQKEAIKYVSAQAQAQVITKLIENNKLTTTELDIIHRARNHKGNRHPKNTDIITYKYATALEALIGYLYLNKDSKLEEIMNYVIERS